MTTCAFLLGVAVTNTINMAALVVEPGIQAYVSMGISGLTIILAISYLILVLKAYRKFQLLIRRGLLR